MTYERVPADGDADGQTTRTAIVHLALIISVLVVAMAGLGVICVFKPPQEWQLVNAIVGHLKDVLVMLVGGWLAIMNNSRPPTALPPPKPDAGGVA